METLLEIDKQLFLLLNQWGNPSIDGFWKFITVQFYWSPVFLFVFYVTQKKIGWKVFIKLILLIAILILVTDQFTNLVKFLIDRTRPCNDLSLVGKMRVVMQRSSPSFFSGHASNSMANAVLFFFILKKYYRYAYLVFLFPLLFGYSRIYLGLHFPSDILVGYFIGAIFGYCAYLFFKNKILLFNPSNSESVSYRK